MSNTYRRRPLPTILAALAAVGCLVAAGCSGSDDDEASTSTTSSSAATVDGKDALTPLIGSVTFPPVPFEGSDGKNHLVYELSVTNFTSGKVTIDGLKVLDAASGKTIDDLDAARLHQRVQPAGERDSTDHLDAGQSATIFLHVTLDKSATVPEKLVHEVAVTAEAAPPGKNSVTERLGATTVDKRTLPVLAAPLAGERYIAADGCCDASRHTRAILPVNGQTFVAQRYAIDYEQADEQNRIYVGNPTDPKSYFIFGKNVLASADGTVVGTRNDLPEQTPGTFPAGIGIDEADGNFVVLDIGDGFFINYAHMQPGSVKPKLGDKVKKGDILGLVGNTGNSVAPHLHFHVMNGPSPLAAQGLPYLNASFSVTGQVASTADFDAAEGTGIPLVLLPNRPTTKHTDQLIMDQNVVTFD
ncbi:M23 family metallopeptidase [Antrihabitans stalactiti]|uniref:M23 family peptidase n=1 Tax=Antrihabitans stalactiti TaxID=2584121 RepID=A0A848KDY3_9NOCA|nr:peptidoglycan DD-metalloendopeptidase family protein [Antrihabitans stalactiti]NMN95966.1 M23 family peptidase [Antrihabitans stalactiti]